MTVEADGWTIGSNSALDSNSSGWIRTTDLTIMSRAL